MAELPKNLTQRKAELLIKSALLREQLAVTSLSLFQMPDIVSKGFDILGQLNKIKKNPLFIVSLALIILAIKPRRLISWAISATVVFKTWQRFKPVVMPIIGYLKTRKK